MRLLVEMEITNAGGETCARDFEASLLAPSGAVVARGRPIPISSALVFRGIAGIKELRYTPDQALEAHTRLIPRGARTDGVLWLTFAPFLLRVFSETTLQVTFRDVRGREWAARYALVDSAGNPMMLFAADER
jgi:hypothetical protein